jgi:hypothetical protein
MPNLLCLLAHRAFPGTLSEKKPIPSWIFYFHFEGFGHARTRVLQVRRLKTQREIPPQKINARTRTGNLAQVPSRDSPPGRGSRLASRSSLSGEWVSSRFGPCAPHANTLPQAQLDFDHMTFQFKLFDRNAQTTRLCQWCMLHVPNITFRYRLHEKLTVRPCPPVSLG